MIHTDFDAKFMSNTGKSFEKEYLLTGGNGSYSSSTIGECNTRKYHGLFVAQQPGIDDDLHVLLSSLDATATYKEQVFQLATHQYPDIIYPGGYSYIDHFSVHPFPQWIYSFDDCVLVKDIIMPENEQAILIRYSVAEATDKVHISLLPMLAFRNVHKLRKAGMDVSKKIHEAPNGIKIKPATEYTPLFIQTSQKTEFVTAPDWYYNIEYPIEQMRGYDYAEDLFVPGHFSLQMKKGDKLVVYIGLEEAAPRGLQNRFNTLLKKAPVLHTEKDYLQHAAKQFVIKHGNEVRIKAGYHWFGTWGRDTFIALPGLLLTTGQEKEFLQAIDTALADLKNGLLPNVGVGKHAQYNSADASLWFIWALNQYAIFTGNRQKVWELYSKQLKEILDSYRKGTNYNIKMDSDGLVYAGQEGVALTWMDAVVNGAPVTPRTGKAVEINALWYNAVCFCLDLAHLHGDKVFIDEWHAYPDLIAASFYEKFWSDDRQYLADCVNGNIIDWSVRPNQVFAVSMPYSPAPVHCRKAILDIVKDELLTNRGLRTLAASDNKYVGACIGNQDQRDMAYHQGTVWPWLWGAFTEAYLKEYKGGRLDEIHEICFDFSNMLEERCLYSIPEIYNGDEPHESVGTVAQAWSVAELLRMEYLLEKYAVASEKIATGMV